MCIRDRVIIVVIIALVIRNDNLHRDLNVEYVSEIITKYADKHDQRIQIHDNPIMRHVVEEAPHVLRRLKRQKPHDLVSQ